MQRRLLLITTARTAAAALVAAALLAACAHAPAPALPPIVFVHGNGDNAAVWTTTLWRYESNGWPRERLHAVDLPYPLARDDNTQAQDGRSSTDDQRSYLASEIHKVLQATGATQVVLVGNSRGALTIRNTIQTDAGQSKVSHAILGGGTNHGVWANAGFRPGNEFNGAGPFLLSLNAPKGANGDEVTPGPKWLTIRSDNYDKFAQPDGVWIGARGTPTHVSFDGPALKGATNVVLPGRDHREVAFHADAFAKTFEFITGKPPTTTAVTPEPRITLDGKVSGSSAAGPTNLPLLDSRIQVFAVDATSGARHGAALVDKTITADGRWGPLRTDSNTALEFVISAQGYATTHIYRAPFARSSDIVNLRAERLGTADRDAAAVVTLTRPRGYFGLPRDTVELDGITPAPGIPTGVAGVSSSKLKLTDGVGRAVKARFNTHTLVGLAWPAADNHVVLLELHD